MSLINSSVHQLLAVITTSWKKSYGKLFCYESSNNKSKWEIIGNEIDVNVGQKGLAYGRGLHPTLEIENNIKKERDLKSPAGVFKIGDVFGDREHQKFSKNMPFLLIEDDLHCVDDPNSIYYNQFVHSCSIKNIDWNSSEKMIDYNSYSLGLVIEHNLKPIKKGFGSCIFMHRWKMKKLASHGCTTMSKKDLIKIISWLDKKKNPLIIQLPIEEYNKKKNIWNLPILKYY
jgi:L,D-peptidoglycan transpeptidase YkuD (ErfK/YbiS/YcfS/YnhG family)